MNTVELINSMLGQFAARFNGPHLFEPIQNPYIAVVFVLSMILYFLIFGLSRISLYIFVALAMIVPWALGVSKVIPGKDITPYLFGVTAFAIAGTLYELWKKNR